MRRLAILIISLAWCCTQPPPYIPEIFTVTGVNFSRFTDKNFMFTPNKYDGQHEARGLLKVTYMPEAKQIKKVVRGKGGVIQWDIAPLNLDDALDKMYDACIAMGANALTEIKIESITERYGVGSPAPVTINGYEISGFAIKRGDP